MLRIVLRLRGFQATIHAQEQRTSWMARQLYLRHHYTGRWEWWRLLVASKSFDQLLRPQIHDYISSVQALTVDAVYIIHHLIFLRRVLKLNIHML